MYRPTHITGIFGALILMLCIQASHADNATWKRHPQSGDWNTKTNWTPAHVPNGSAGVATFALSNNTSVSISANTEVSGITFTSAATSPYTISESTGLTFTVSGTGITNNSATLQTFVTGPVPFGEHWAAGRIVFSNSATAGANIAYVNNGTFGFEGNEMIFKNNSTGGSAYISNLGVMQFLDRSTAGSAYIENEYGGFIQFAGQSTAGTAGILDFTGSGLLFRERSTAGNATIGAYDSGYFQFSDSASAGNATIYTYSDSRFDGHSTAGNATITVGDVGFGGSIIFTDFSTGGTAAITLLPSLPGVGAPSWRWIIM